MALLENPNLALIPSGYKAGKIYSVLPTNGVGDFSFARGTIATRINSSGLIEEVASNVPRLNYPMIDGVVKGCPSLLLEPERTNLIPYSQDFSQSNWVKVNNATVSATKVISPDGTLNASQIIFDGTSQGRIEDAISGLTQGAYYTVSVYARVSSGTQVVEFGSVSDFEYTLTTEWQRLTSTEIENDTVGYPRLICNDAATIEIWAFQLEQGSYSTSYIPNYGTAAGVTRSSETANGSGDAATFNSEQGVLMVEISALSDDVDTKRISLSDGTSSNRLSISFSNNLYGGILVSNGDIVINNSFEGFQVTLSNKIAIKYKQNDFSVFINGFEVYTNPSGNTPTVLNQLRFDNGYNSGLPFYGNTKQIQYFDTSDIDIEQLTSWVSFQEMAEGQLYTIE